MYETRIVSTTIAAHWREVYNFVRNPSNLPLWAAGLASGIREERGRWLAESPMGTVEVKMAPENGLGVLDHHVTLPSGQVVYNALRAVPNRDGCELTFTVFRTEDLDEKQFADACAHVERDLAELKRLMSAGLV